MFKRPARPDPWTSEVPGYYYVSDTTGTDAGRTNGTPSAPRKTIPNPLGPGTYCEVNGVYNTNSAGFSKINGVGTAGEWVANTGGPAWVVGADAENRASFSNSIICYGSYLCIEYFDTLQGHGKIQVSSSTANMGYSADHLLIRHCEVSVTAASSLIAFSVNHNSTGDTSHVVVYANKVHGPGGEEPGDVDVDRGGVVCGDFVTNLWILENEIYDLRGTGVTIAGATTGPSGTSYIYVGRNHVYRTWAAGIATKTSDHCVFSENLVHDIKWTSWSDAKCIGAQYSTESLWILYNHCYNGNLGIKSGTTYGPNPTNIYVIGNVVHDILAIPEDPAPPLEGTGSSGAITLWNGPSKLIIGNTIYNCHNGIAIPTVQSTVQFPAIIENNIICNCLYNQIYLDAGPQYSVIRNNLLYQEGGAAKLRFGHSYYTTSGANALNFVSGLIEANPQFTNAANNNFSILTGSRAKDAGLAAANLTFDVYAAYMADFGVPINVDKNGLVRPQGTKWDIGAYEFSTLQVKVPFTKITPIKD